MSGGPPPDENLIAELMALSVAYTTLATVVLDLAGKHGTERRALLAAIEAGGNDTIGRQGFPVAADRLEAVRENCRVRFSDLVTTIRDDSGGGR